MSNFIKNTINRRNVFVIVDNQGEVTQLALLGFGKPIYKILFKY